MPRVMAVLGITMFIELQKASLVLSDIGLEIFRV